MSEPANVAKRSGRHLLRRFGQSGIGNWKSYSSNSTTSPILRRRHLGVGKDLRPLGEREVGRDNQRRALVEAADEVEQELSAGLGGRQVAEFVEHNQIDVGEGVSEPPRTTPSPACPSRRFSPG